MDPSLLGGDAGGGAGGGSGGRGRLRRSASAPELLSEASLESLADQALALNLTPCSVLPAEALEEDGVAASLRQALEAAQREILAAVQAGVPGRGTLDASGGGGQAGPGEQHQRRAAAASDAEAMARLQRAAPAPGRGAADRAAAAAAGPLPADDQLLGEAELAGLSAREREAAIKRAKNREAARRSRERKVERIAGLRADIEALRSNNFVLLRCIEEVARKGLAARAEQRLLRDKLARLTDHHHAPAAAHHAPVGAPSAAGACTPPAARRAAALEEELQLMAVDGPPASPTHLLRPGFLGHAEQRTPDAAARQQQQQQPSHQQQHQQRQQQPTSAELRRQLQEALGGGGWEGRGAAADANHHLHPSPSAARRALQPQAAAAAAMAPSSQLGPLHEALQPQLHHQSVLALKQHAQGLGRSCSAPGGLLASAAAGMALADASGGARATDAAQQAQQPWFRGVAV